jgi:hypothetical protein
LTEASDGEEEKSQESSEEKEEVVAYEKSLVSPPDRESAVDKAGLETGWESCGEPAAPVTDRRIAPFP